MFLNFWSRLKIVFLHQKIIYWYKSTVKPVYNVHPWDPPKVAVVHRWSLCRGSSIKIGIKISLAGISLAVVAVFQKCPLTQVGLRKQIGHILGGIKVPGLTTLQIHTSLTFLIMEQFQSLPNLKPILNLNSYVCCLIKSRLIICKNVAWVENLFHSYFWQ